jgi:hypothetical protein
MASGHGGGRAPAGASELQRGGGGSLVGASEFEARWPRRQVGEDRSAAGERGWSLSAAGARVIAARI